MQHTLLALHEFVRHRPAHTLDNDTRSLLDLLIAAAFSLWRGVFLADTFRDVAQIQQSREAFLLKVLTNNAITFADDRANRHWSVEDYLENAKLRLARAITFVDTRQDLGLTEKLMPFLRLRGTFGADLTRYEWEGAHYTLRALLKVITPDTNLNADPPAPPSPRASMRFLRRASRTIKHSPHITHDHHGRRGLSAPSSCSRLSPPAVRS